MNGRDVQRGRVYAWEDREVGPHDPSRVAFAQAQGIVDAIWAEAGLRFPPRVEALPPQATTRLADASRLAIRIPAAIASWCLLHELAHAMTSTHDGRSDQHGPGFMGIYLQLLERYLRLPRAGLLASLDAAGIAVDPSARPAFVDVGATSGAGGR